MTCALIKEEAVKRMQRRNKDFICWTLRDLTVEWKYVSAAQTRNYDGSFVGIEQDPDRKVLQRMVWRNEQEPRYTIFW